MATKKAAAVLREFDYIKPDEELASHRVVITAFQPSLHGLDVTELPVPARTDLLERYEAYQTSLQAQIKTLPTFEDYLKAVLTEAELPNIPERKYRNFSLNRIIEKGASNEQVKAG